MSKTAAEPASGCAPIDADVSAACQYLCGVETSIHCRSPTKRLSSTPPSTSSPANVSVGTENANISSSRWGASISKAVGALSREMARNARPKTPSSAPHT